MGAEPPPLPPAEPAMPSTTAPDDRVPTPPSDDPRAAAERRAQIARALDLKDSNSILFFGTKAQERLTEIADTMLEGVRNKDLGEAGSALNEMVSTIRGFKVDDLTGKRPGFLARLVGTVDPVARFVQQYEEVRRQIEAIGDKLESHKTTLLRDIASLDRLYSANLEYFHTLNDYIEAGEDVLRRLDAETIPALEQVAVAGDDVLKSQELRDVRAARDDLDRRVHDLKLTRQVAMQGLPSIRLVQENDKSLVTKITSTLANTVPLWRQQLAQAVTIFRSREAGRTLKDATDLTNELLLANAENLRLANQEVRTQVARGVFDIEKVKQANALLISTIEDGLAIADAGKRARAAASAELEACETALRRSLEAARAKAAGQPPAAVR